jgi:hypothetical protein
MPKHHGEEEEEEEEAVYPGQERVILFQGKKREPRSMETEEGSHPKGRKIRKKERNGQELSKRPHGRSNP